MNQFIMSCMAIGVLLGGLDRIFGNRFGFGTKFEEGFHLLGPMALSMVGITCLSPVLADFIQTFLSPVLGTIGIDPGICGGILAIDTGGYPLAMELALNQRVGQYAGTIIAATFGCTIVFVIPVGMGYLSAEEQTHFANGLLIGLAALPAGLIPGGLLCGLSLGETVFQSILIFLISAFLLLGLSISTGRMIRWFTCFARAIQIVATLGLMLAAFQSLTEWVLLPGLAPLEDAMAVVCSIGIVMLGCMPLTLLIQRLLRQPIRWIGKKNGLTSASATGMLLGIIIAMPALAMLKDMDKQGRIVNGAFLVCGASAFSAHLGFTLGAAPDMALPLLASKMIGAAVSAVIAILVTKRGNT